MWRCWAWLLLCWVGWANAAPQPVPLYVYHDFPPYIVGGQPDLSHALADQLSRRSAGRYRFKVVVLPRKRVDVLIATPGWRGVVAWVNPRWIGDNAAHLAWTAPLLDETEWWVVRRAAPQSLQQIAQADGYRFGGLIGHHYAELDAAVRAGRIFRFDTASMQSLVSMLLAGRVDVITMPSATELWFHGAWPRWRERVLLLPRGAAYQRYLVSDRGDPALVRFLADSVVALRNDPGWQPLPAPLPPP